MSRACVCWPDAECEPEPARCGANADGYSSAAAEAFLKRHELKQDDHRQAIAVRDLFTGHIWGPVARTNGFFGDEDYGIVTRFFNEGIGQTT